MNGGVDVTLAGSVAEVQEHDDSAIKGDPNAIAPFSKGRGQLLGTTLRYENGTFIFQRAVYNVVRGGTQANADVQAFFGPNGFLCSNAARDLIKAGGLEQMATSAAGGVCGEVTQQAVTNYTTNQSVATTTDLTFASTKAGEATLTAAVTAANSPSGTVTFTAPQSVVFSAAAAAARSITGSAVTAFQNVTEIGRAHV